MTDSSHESAPPPTSAAGSGTRRDVPAKVAPHASLAPAGVSARLRPYRFLCVVYGLAVATAAWEVTHRRPEVDLRLDSEPNFTNTLFDLYPDRGEANYERSLQLALCLQANAMKGPPPAICRQFETLDSREEIRRRLEQALATGIKTEEGVYYHNLQILIGTGASPRKVNAAYDAWKSNFPHSRLPDPRPRRRTN